jgi:hypothetical protein
MQMTKQCKGAILWKNFTMMRKGRDHGSGNCFDSDRA